MSTDTMNLGRWADIRGVAAFATQGPSFAGISGGRTSAMMAALLPDDAVLCFENTGREHPRTYDFVEELDAALGRRIVWLEFRKPRSKGARPRDFEFAVVDYKTADRSGRPFAEVLEAVAEFRATKGEEPLSPWARGRLCTAYMKNRVQQRYAASLGCDAWETFVGLRHDEPARVHRLAARSGGRETFRMPLYAAGIVKANVMEFWRGQSFDLRVEERQGNCTACFLKDESDLSRVLAEPETDAAWWIRMSETYARFGGENFTGYRQLASETGMRLAIESALRGRPALDGAKAKDLVSALASLRPPPITERRFHLVVIQERLRLRGETQPFSCLCEAARGVDEDDEPQMSLAFMGAA